MRIDKKDAERAPREEFEDIDVPEREGESVKGGISDVNDRLSPANVSRAAARGFNPQPDPPGVTKGSLQSKIQGP